jgi:hypothetical protein
MADNDNRSDPAKKEIEKETSLMTEYYNVYILNNIQRNLVTDGLVKPSHVIVEEKPEGILIRRLEI